ncbi:MAG TPA: MFS transporter [Streptosporangiaceae bacterium]
MTQAAQQARQLSAARAAAVFWQYWTASTISMTGDAVTAVALPLTAVKVLHASSFEVSLLTAATYAAWLLIGLPAGVIVGRLPLRGTQVAMDLIRAAALASVPAVAWAGDLHLPQLVIVAFTISLASVIFDVGNATFLPSVVPSEQLIARNSLTSGSAAATQLGGPALGGLLVQLLGAATSLVADVVSYLVSAVMLQGLPRPPRQRQDGPGTSMRVLIGDGWRFVTRHPVIRPCALTATLDNFLAGGLMALTPVFLVRTVGLPAWAVGALIAAEGAGSLIGAALTPRLTGWLGSARAILAAESAGALLGLAMPLAAAGWRLALFAVGSAGLGAGVVVVSVTTRTHRQQVSPPDLLPRVMATVRFISWGVIPFGALAAGAAASALGNRAAMWLVCGLTLIGPLILLFSPVRGRRDLLDPAAPGS